MIRLPIRPGPVFALGSLLFAGSLLFIGSTRSNQQRGLNLFQMVARSEIIAQATIREGSLKYAIVELDEVFKGEPPDRTLRIAFRDFNYDRPHGTDPMVFPDGQAEILFLVPYDGVNRRKEKNRDIYTLFKGFAGRITLPAEGPETILEALRELALLTAAIPAEQITGLKDLLDHSNPYLVEAAMAELLRLRAGDPGLYLALIPLLSNPSPGVRQEALELFEQIFEGGPQQSSHDPRPDEARGALAAVIERARNDPEPAVRAGAVTALASWPYREEVESELRAIARLDPEQEVRYEAERALFRLEPIAPGSGRGAE